MLARTCTATLFGIEAHRVIVEADAGPGLPRLTIVGLPDGAIREAAERVRTAIRRSGQEWPAGRITVNLAPADLKKEGTGLDLAIAVGIIAAHEGWAHRRLDGVGFLGELSLSGAVRAVPGTLAVARALRGRGETRLVVAPQAVAEASLVAGLDVIGVETLAESLAVLKDPTARRTWPQAETVETVEDRVEPDLAEVRGQPSARRALEVAAAGGHNLLLFGPPGSGKTMLARRLPGVLPPPGDDEALEITLVASCAGRIGSGGLVTRRPFRAPHHTITPAGLIGGGLRLRPGEVTLAHGGALFLDEIAECRRDVLDLLRQPLEEGTVLLSRFGRSARFPARFVFIAAMNPCPCGYNGDPVRHCACTPLALQRYRNRLSGPLLDRIDLHVEVPRPGHLDLASRADGECTATVRERVIAARRRQRARHRIVGRHLNAELSGTDLRRWCSLDRQGTRLLERAILNLGLSPRAHDRILRVARTIADLDGKERIEPGAVAEAVGYRRLDRPAGPIA